MSDSDSMDAMKLLLSVADSYHDFAAGDRCNLNFSLVRNDLKSNPCLVPLFQSRIEVGEPELMLPIINGGQPTQEMVRRLAPHMILSDSIPPPKGLDYEASVMAFLNTNLPSGFKHRYFKLDDDTYEDKSTDEYLYSVAYTLQGKDTNIAQMKNLVYDFFATDSQTDKPIGIMTDCIQNPKVFGKVFDDMTTSGYKGVLNLFASTASCYDRANNKINEGRYVCKVVPENGAQFSINVSNTNKTQVSFVIAPDSNYTRISVLPKDHTCATPATLLEELQQAQYSTIEWNGEISEAVLTDEVLGTLDMSVANLCKVMGKITNFDNLTDTDKLSAFKPIIRNGNAKNQTCTKFQDQFWKLMKYASSINYNPRLILYDIKRSMDYGQAEYIRALRLLRKSKSTLTLADRSLQAKTHSIDLSKFSEFVLVTFDRLCYMKCLVEGVPCIYIKGVNTLLLTKPKTSAESVAQVLDGYKTFDIVRHFYNNTLDETIRYADSRLSAHIDSMISTTMEKVFDSSIISGVLPKQFNESETSQTCQDIFKIVEWNLKRFHILYCIALYDLKTKISTDLKTIQNNLNDPESNLTICLKSLGVQDNKRKRDRENESENELGKDDDKRYKTDTYMSGGALNSKELFDKIRKTPEFAILEKLLKTASSLNVNGENENMNVNSHDDGIIDKSIETAAAFVAQYLSKRKDSDLLKAKFAQANSASQKLSIERDIETLVFQHKLTQSHDTGFMKAKLKAIMSSQPFTTADVLRKLLSILNICFASDIIGNPENLHMEIEDAAAIFDNVFIPLQRGRKKDALAATASTWASPRDLLSAEDGKLATELGKIAKFSPILDISSAFNHTMQVICGLPDMHASGKPGILSSTLQFVVDNINKPGKLRQPRSFKLNKVLAVTDALFDEADKMNQEDKLQLHEHIRQELLAIASDHTLEQVVDTDSAASVAVFSTLVQSDTYISEVLASQLVTTNQLIEMAAFKVLFNTYKFVLSQYKFNDVVSRVIPQLSEHVNLFRQRHPEVASLAAVHTEVTANSAMSVLNSLLMIQRRTDELDIQQLNITNTSLVELSITQENVEDEETRMLMQRYKDELMSRITCIKEAYNVATTWGLGNETLITSVQTSLFVLLSTDTDGEDRFANASHVFVSLDTVLNSAALTNENIDIVWRALDAIIRNTPINLAEYIKLMDECDESDMFSMSKTWNARNFVGGADLERYMERVPKHMIEEYNEYADIVTELSEEYAAILLQNLPDLRTLWSAFKPSIAKYYSILKNGTTDYSTVAMDPLTVAPSHARPEMRRPTARDTNIVYSSLSALKYYLASRDKNKIASNAISYANSLLAGLDDDINSTSNILEHQNTITDYMQNLQESTTLSDILWHSSEIYAFGMHLVHSGYLVKPIIEIEQVSRIDGTPYQYMTDFEIVSRLAVAQTIVANGGQHIDDILIVARSILDASKYFKFRANANTQRQQGGHVHNRPRVSYTSLEDYHHRYYKPYIERYYK
jgi:hypothetical protein